MAQFFRVECKVDDDPGASWVKTLSRSELLHLHDPQGTPVYVPPCLCWWANEPHVEGNLFEAQYGPDPVDETAAVSYEAEAL